MTAGPPNGHQQQLRQPLNSRTSLATAAVLTLSPLPFYAPTYAMLFLFWGQDPCTQGVDVSRAVVPLKTFATLGGCTAPRAASASSQG